MKTGRLFNDLLNKDCIMKDILHVFSLIALFFLVVIIIVLVCVEPLPEPSMHLSVEEIECEINLTESYIEDLIKDRDEFVKLVSLEESSGMWNSAIENLLINNSNNLSVQRNHENFEIWMGRLCNSRIYLRADKRKIFIETA